LLYQVIIAAAAQKQIHKLGFRQDDPVVATILALRMNPRPKGTLHMAGDEHLWRVRVGQYRIIYSIDDSEAIVRVLRVARRSEDTYKDLLN
jgi:mRNA interferase RelE/StbE